MNIRFTSSLTPEDENLVAPAVLRALTSILDLLPIAYVIRIDTTDSKVYEQGGGIGTEAPLADSFLTKRRDLRAAPSEIASQRLSEDHGIPDGTRHGAKESYRVVPNRSV